MPSPVWEQCVNCLQEELPSQQFNTWIKPLKAEHLHSSEAGDLCLYAPNRFVKEWVMDKFLERISELVHQVSSEGDCRVVLEIGAPKRVNGTAVESEHDRTAAAHSQVSAVGGITTARREQTPDAEPRFEKAAASPVFEGSESRGHRFACGTDSASTGGSRRGDSAPELPG